MRLAERRQSTGTVLKADEDYGNAGHGEKGGLNSTQKEAPESDNTIVTLATVGLILAKGIGSSFATCLRGYNFALASSNCRKTEDGDVPPSDLRASMTARWGSLARVFSSKSE